MTKEEFVNISNETKEEVAGMLMKEDCSFDDLVNDMAKIVGDLIADFLSEEGFEFFNSMEWISLLDGIYLRLIMDFGYNGVGCKTKLTDKEGNEYWFCAEVANFEDFYDMIH